MVPMIELTIVPVIACIITAVMASIMKPMLLFEIQPISASMIAVISAASIVEPITTHKRLYDCARKCILFFCGRTDAHNWTHS